jgi:hypothetical protein
MKPWIRWALAAAAIAAGALMVSAGLGRPRAWPFHAVGAFCFIVAGCCATRGRINDLCWSLLGSFLFAGSAGYVVAMALQGRWISSPGEPSLLWAALLFATVGWWGALVAWRMGFGLRRRYWPHLGGDPDA